MITMSDGLEDDFCLELDDEGRIVGTTDNLDLSTRIVETSVPNVGHLLRDLKYDAVLSNCGFVNDNFWLERGSTPRCTLEALALRIFEHHTKHVSEEEFGATSGAEWWVQVKRPGDANPEKRDIGFHWDKDERFFQAYGLFLYPQLSTVTYLTGSKHEAGEGGMSGGSSSPGQDDCVGVGRRCSGSSGGSGAAVGQHGSASLAPRQAPTLVLECRAEFDGSVTLGRAIQGGALCFPSPGRHLSFDGRFLHAAPKELAAAALQPPASTSTSGASTVAPGSTLSEEKPSDGNHHKRGRGEEDRDHSEDDDDVRITFLVNVWLKHRPNSIKPFPDALISSVSDRGGDLPVPLMATRTNAANSAGALSSLSAQAPATAVTRGRSNDDTLPLFPTSSVNTSSLAGGSTATSNDSKETSCVMPPNDFQPPATSSALSSSSPQLSFTFGDVGRLGEDLHLQFHPCASDLAAAQSLAESSGAGGVKLDFCAGRTIHQSKHDGASTRGGGGECYDTKLDPAMLRATQQEGGGITPVRAWFSHGTEEPGKKAVGALVAAETPTSIGHKNEGELETKRQKNK